MPEPRLGGRSRLQRVLLGGVAVAALALPSCSGAGSGAGPDQGDVAPDGTTSVAVPGTADVLCSATLQEGGSLASSALVETSGLAPSRAHPDVLWAHDDSGGGAEVFAVGLDGSDLGTVGITGARSLDWEDIALLDGSAGEGDRLVVADIGDNPGGGARETEPARLYVVAEPDPPGPSAVGRSAPATAIDVAYADGQRDAEALLADPLSGDLFVLSKQWDGAAAGVYRVPADAVTDEPTAVVMERVGSVGGTDRALVTSGDVAADGRAVVVRTYDSVRIWARDPDATIPEALADEPLCMRPVVERQGEAVAVLVDGTGYVTVSEGEGVAVKVHRAP